MSSKTEDYNKEHYNETGVEVIDNILNELDIAMSGIHDSQEWFDDWYGVPYMYNIYKAARIAAEEITVLRNSLSQQNGM